MFPKARMGFAVLVMLLPPTVSAQTQEERDVLTVIHSFLDGLRTKDTGLMKSHLDTLSRFTLLRPGPNGTRVFLARLNGRWKILNVSDTFRQQGCGNPWPD
jgi:hypothetical protein